MIFLERFARRHLGLTSPSANQTIDFVAASDEYGEKTSGSINAAKATLLLFSYFHFLTQRQSWKAIGSLRPLSERLSTETAVDEEATAAGPECSRMGRLPVCETPTCRRRRRRSCCSRRAASDARKLVSGTSKRTSSNHTHTQATDSWLPPPPPHCRPTHYPPPLSERRDDEPIMWTCQCDRQQLHTNIHTRRKKDAHVCTRALLFNFTSNSTAEGLVL